MRYARFAHIPIHWFEKHLNLPEGFTLGAVWIDAAHQTIDFHIVCPKKERFAVPDGAPIPQVRGIEYVCVDGTTSIEWEGLEREVKDNAG